MHVDGLVLLVVVLQAQGVPGLDVQNLADVLLGLGPMELVSPRLVHTCHGCLGHSVVTVVGIPARPNASSRHCSISSTVPRVRTRAAMRAMSPAWVSCATRRAI